MLFEKITPWTSSSIALIVLVTSMISFRIDTGECHVLVSDSSVKMNGGQVNKGKQTLESLDIRNTSRSLVISPGIHKNVGISENLKTMRENHGRNGLPLNGHRSKRIGKRQVSPQDIPESPKPPNPDNNKPKSQKRAEKDRQLAALNMMNANNDSKDKNPVIDTINGVSSFLTKKLKNLQKRFQSMIKKFRECVTIIPFSIDKSCLK